MKKIILLAIFLALNLHAFDFGSLVDTATKELTQEKSTSKTLSNLSDATVSKGLKEALKLGVDYGVKELSKPDGYLNNKTVKIPLPENLQAAESIVRKFGGDKIADDLINSMNSAATQAAPKTAPIFVNSIDKMTINDAKDILAGDNNSATKYFEKNTKNDLKRTIKPIIKSTMQKNNVADYYNTFNQYYKEYAKEYIDNSSLVDMAKGFGADKYIPSTDQDLEDYISDKSISGLFTMIATKESQIRENPVSQSTSLLKKVFGN